MPLLSLVPSTPSSPDYLPQLLMLPGFADALKECALLAENEAIVDSKESFRTKNHRGVRAQQQILVHVGNYLCTQSGMAFKDEDGQGRFISEGELAGFKWRLWCRRGASCKAGFRIHYRKGRTEDLMNENRVQFSLFDDADMDNEFTPDSEYINVLLIVEVVDALVSGVIVPDAEIRLHLAIPTEMKNKILRCSERERFYTGLIADIPSVTSSLATSGPVPVTEELTDLEEISDLEEIDDCDDSNESTSNTG